MKGLKLLTYSKEEIERIWNDLKADDVLVSISHNHWGDDYNISYCKVEKKTPKGSIRLDNGTLLKYFPSNYYLLNEDIKEWINKIKLEKEIINLLFYLDRDKKSFKENLEFDDAIKLKEILEKCVNKSK